MRNLLNQEKLRYCSFLYRSATTFMTKFVQCFTHEIKLQKLVIAPVKKELGLAFKGSQKNVVEALEVNYGIFSAGYLQHL